MGGIMNTIIAELQSESRNYINSLEAIDLIAKHTNNNHMDVCRYLVKKDFAYFVASYSRNDLYVYESDTDYLSTEEGIIFEKTHQILWAVIKLFDLEYDKESTLNSFNYPPLSEFETFFWNADDFFNKSIVKSLNITIETWETYRLQHPKADGFDIAKFFRRLDDSHIKSLPELPSHLKKIIFNKNNISIEDSSLFCYSTNDEKKFKFSTLADEHAIGMIWDAIESDELQLDEEEKIQISELKLFLYKRGYVIRGFNDDLRYLPIQNHEVKDEVQQLKDQLAQARQRIQELESNQSIDNQPLHPRTRNGAYKIIAVLANMAELPDEPFTAFNMIQAHANSIGLEVPEKDTTAGWLRDSKNT